MKKKILGIFVCMMLIITSITVLGNININNNSEDQSNDIVSYDVDWWPMSHHDLQNTGYSTSKAPNTNYTCWNFSSGERFGGFTPVVVNDRLYFGTMFDESLGGFDDFSILKRCEGFPKDDEFEGSFYCLDAKTGEKLWDFKTELVVFTASVVDGRVYFGTAVDNESTDRITGKVYCLNAETGDEIWNVTIDTPPEQDCVLFDPTVTSGRLYISEQYGKLHCFNSDDGSHIWTVDIGYREDRQTSKTCAVVDGRVYINFGIVIGPGKTYCFDAENGDELWNFSIGRSEYGSPAIIDGKVFVNGFNWCAIDGVLFCLNSTSGELIWKSQYNGADSAIGWSSPSVCNNNIYVLTMDYLMCFDFESGSEKWRVHLYNDDSPTSPSIADGKIYYGTGISDKLYCRNAENGSLIWSYQVGNVPVHPAIADGWVYVAANGAQWKHAIYAFRDNEQPDAPGIDGSTKCKPGIDYDYTFVATDPDGDDIWYHICWGDKEIIYIYGPFPSGEELTLSYNWTDKGTYNITCWARDIYDAVSDVSSLKVTVPRTRASSNLWYQWFLDRHPILEKLLGLIRAG